MTPLDLPMPDPGEETRIHVRHVHGVYVEDVKRKKALDEAHQAEHQWAFGVRLIEHIHSKTRDPYMNGAFAAFAAAEPYPDVQDEEEGRDSL